MSKKTLTLLAVGMLGVGGFGSMDTEALAQTLSEEGNSRSMSQLHSRDTRGKYLESDQMHTDNTPSYKKYSEKWNGQKTRKNRYHKPHSHR